MYERVTAFGRSLAVIAFCLALGACASLETLRTENRSNLARISVGMPKEQVLQLMGTGTRRFPGNRPSVVTNPYRTESHRADGYVLEILYYYTDIKAADGAITDDELTPLIFKDGELEGFGWSYFDAIATTHGLRIRR